MSLRAEVWLLIEAKQNGDHEVAETLSGCRIHQHLSATPSFNVGDSYEREQQVGDRITSCQQTCELFTQANRADQYCRNVSACSPHPESRRRLTCGKIIAGDIDTCFQSMLFLLEILVTGFCFLPTNCCMNCVPAPRSRRRTVQVPALPSPVLPLRRSDHLTPFSRSYWTV